MITMTTYKTREDWLSARKSRIGGSDASSIMGLNPWKSNEQLFLEKTGQAHSEDISDKPCVRYGNDAEPYIRKLFELDHTEFEVHYEEHNMWTNDKYPFAHASLDGWLTELLDKRRGILEIKTTEILQYSQWDKWKNKIPDNYYCQLLHYFLVTEFDFAILKARLRKDDAGLWKIEEKEYMIERQDVLDDIEMLRIAEEKFYDNIIKGNKPALILPGI